MPVLKETIKPKIKLALEQAKTKGAEEGTEYLSDELAQIIVDAIKSGDVVPGIPIAGSAPTGPVTGATSGKGTIQ